MCAIILLLSAKMKILIEAVVESSVSAHKAIRRTLRTSCTALGEPDIF